MNVDRIVEEYSRTLRDKYRLLASKTSELLGTILASNKVTPHSVTFREKDLEKLKEKIKREAKDYHNPLSEVTDLAGVRIITYFPSDVDRILPLIEEEFEVDQENSIDKRKAADPSSFGYASVHLVVSFRADRLKLPEYGLFQNMKCEIQVRTILQHGWAEIEHDIAYKSTEEIPFELRRRFASLAGLLEIADREFERLREDELKVRETIEKHVSRDDLDIGVNLDSLQFYLQKYHQEKEVESYRLSLFLHFVRSCGIKTLLDLDASLSPKALAKADEHIDDKPANRCPKERKTRCLLRYFFAIGRHFNMTHEHIGEAARCPVLTIE